ncbi:MAG TPA: hypothetical protein VIB48_01545 [Acidimicrobiia bacterium]|jgi:hypothetical protein
MSAPQPVDASAPRPLPPKLLIYYGIPEGVNGIWDAASAAELFCTWDVVVFGVGLQDPGHDYHASTVDIIERMRAAKPALRVFGYIDLSVAASDLPVETMRAHVRQWQASGADSIFFDLAGYSFGTGRARQNTMVDAVHDLGMAVMVNTDVPDDVLGSGVDEQFNPTAEPPHLGPDDSYLLESWVVSTAAFADTSGYRWMVDARRLADSAIKYRDQLGVKIATVSSADYSVTPRQQLLTYFRMSEAMAIAWNLDAYGFAPSGYSGMVPDVNVLEPFPYHPRYLSFVGDGARYTVDPGVTEITRLDVPLTVHIDVQQRDYWCSVAS